MEKSKNFSLKTVDDFSIVEVSTKNSTGKKKTNYVVSRTEPKKTNTKKALSVVDDYLEFDFRANKRAASSKVEENKATKALEEKLNTESSKSSAKKVGENKKVKAEVKKEPVVVVEKNTEGSIKLERDELERHIMRAAEASERFETDDAASRVVLVARMGSLFGCIK